MKMSTGKQQTITALTKSQSGKLYKIFSRAKYMKYKHMFPRMRQSELVSKIIKQWERLTQCDKSVLAYEYISLGMMTSEFQKKEDSQSEEKDFDDLIKQSTTKKSTMQKNQVSEKHNQRPFIQQSDSDFQRSNEKKNFDISQSDGMIGQPSKKYEQIKIKRQIKRRNRLQLVKQNIQSDIRFLLKQIVQIQTKRDIINKKSLIELNLFVSSVVSKILEKQHIHSIMNLEDIPFFFFQKNQENGSTTCVICKKKVSNKRYQITHVKQSHYALYWKYFFLTNWGRIKYISVKNTFYTIEQLINQTAIIDVYFKHQTMVNNKKKYNYLIMTLQNGLVKSHQYIPKSQRARDKQFKQVAIEQTRLNKDQIFKKIFNPLFIQCIEQKNLDMSKIANDFIDKIDYIVTRQQIQKIKPQPQPQPVKQKQFYLFYPECFEWQTPPKQFDYAQIAQKVTQNLSINKRILGKNNNQISKTKKIYKRIKRPSKNTAYYCQYCFITDIQGNASPKIVFNSLNDCKKHIQRQHNTHQQLNETKKMCFMIQNQTICQISILLAFLRHLMLKNNKQAIKLFDYIHDFQRLRNFYFIQSYFYNNKNHKIDHKKIQFGQLIRACIQAGLLSQLNNQMYEFGSGYQFIQNTPSALCKIIHISLCLKLKF